MRTGCGSGQTLRGPTCAIGMGGVATAGHHGRGYFLAIAGLMFVVATIWAWQLFGNSTASAKKVAPDRPVAAAEAKNDADGKPGSGALGGKPIFGRRAAIQSAEECARDPHMNPAGRELTAETRMALQKRIDSINPRLLAMQDQLRIEVETWAQTVIANGGGERLPVKRPNKLDERSLIEQNTYQVTVLQGASSMTVTVRPGDNAIIDQLAIELDAFVIEATNDLKHYFEQE